MINDDDDDNNNLLFMNSLLVRPPLDKQPGCGSNSTAFAAKPCSSPR